MARRREPSPPQKMKNIALVICEGETEKGYLDLLRKWYKSPMKIESHIVGAKITPQQVQKYKENLKISHDDKVSTFLMYDMDVQDTNEKLMRCSAEMLLSNPCFEIWLLLHSKDQKSPISTASLGKVLRTSDAVWANYTKATFSETQQKHLKEHTDIAVERAKALPEYQNPSTGIYKLIEKLKGK